jgi:hypothetical protein
MKPKEAVLEYLLAHPGWHGLDLVNAGVARQSAIYMYLVNLKEDGYVERRDSLEPQRPGYLPRPQYRAIGQLIPVDSSLSPAGA